MRAATWLTHLEFEADTAVRIRNAGNRDDVMHDAARVKAPTLVPHPREDGLVPFFEGGSWRRRSRARAQPPPRPSRAPSSRLA